MDISFLGHPSYNPSGWIYWAIGMVVAGIMTIPILPYFYRHLIGLNKPLGTFHAINTGLAFGGLYLSILTILIHFVFKFKIVNEKMSLPAWKLLAMVILEAFPTLGMAISQGIRYFQGINIITSRLCIGDTICPWYMSLSFWEWMLFLGVLVNLVIFLTVIPEKFIDKK